MARKPINLPDEVKDAVVRDYLAGAKTTVIQWEYKIPSGTMYRILHERQVELRRPPEKPVATDEKPVPAEDFGYVSKTGRQFCRKPGRPRTGEWRHCKGCGKEIYVRPHRIKEGRGNYCKECSGKTFPPPKRVKKPRLELEIPLAVRVRELATRSNGMTCAAAYDELYKILIECLKGDPLGTITVLVPAGETFTPESVLRATEEYFIVQVLRSMPNVEYMGDGTWRAKGG